jgi:phosphatidylethanolamine/phosphatidyl-N-methylethanolamine N-methyltransferase
MLINNDAAPATNSNSHNSSRNSEGGDLLLFIRNAFSKPRSVGALIPASQGLARKIAATCNSLKPSTLIELGPGTGVITEKIGHLNPKLIEIDDQFSNRLREKFPELLVLNECAIEFLGKLDYPVGVICSIPLINNPAANEIKAALSRCRTKGLLDWVVIYSYGNTNPLRGCGFEHEHLVAKISLNFPPARIWLNY